MIDKGEIKRGKNRGGGYAYAGVDLEKGEMKIEIEERNGKRKV